MDYEKEIKKLQGRVKELELKVEAYVSCAEKEINNKNVQNEKITLKEFFENYDKYLCIHCNTEEKAIKLVKEFDKIGYKWNGTYWDIHKEQTCYSNHNGYCDKKFYEERFYKVYEFEDVIFEEPQKELPKFEFNDSEKVTCGKFTEDEKVILRNLPENFNYIARDRDSSLLIFASKPLKKEYYWSNGYGSINMSMYNHLFQSIKWEDEEPCEFRKYL